ncbi:MAG: polysaccharide deacetylase family protein [Thermodesulfobacteriota bacterium]|nr:polysaccharide deacetylase family protein [Thermodesulfobacteriota bacterium]
MISRALGVREALVNLAGGIYLLARKSGGGRQKVRVVAINYHDISSRSFREQIAYIQSHYNVLSPGAFLDWLNNKRVVDVPAVVITFDDGYLSFYEEVYPVLKEKELSVFLFVPTGLVGTDRYFWEDKLQVAFGKTSKAAVTIHEKKFRLYSRLYRRDFYEKILRYLRRLPEETRDVTVKDLAAQLEVEITESDMKQYQFLDWPRILEMDRSGLVVLGAHTVNHPNLKVLTEDAARYEVHESKRKLEEMTGKPVYAFAYPYGDRLSFDGKVVEIVRQNGSLCAFTTILGDIPNRIEDRFTLPRVMLFDYQKKGALALKMNRCSR